MTVRHIVVFFVALLIVLLISVISGGAKPQGLLESPMDGLSSPGGVTVEASASAR